MKHPLPSRLLGLMILPLLLVAGCPVDLTQLPADQMLAGTYWVEYRDGQLMAFELPEFRGETGTWHSLPAAQPDWYTGPALYDVNADGTWIRLGDAGELTLDDVLQTYDPPPRP